MEIESCYESENDEMEVLNSHLLSDQVKYAIVHLKRLDYSNKETAKLCGGNVQSRDIEPSNCKISMAQVSKNQLCG